MIVFLILIGLSVCLSLAYCLLRQRRFFSHSRFRGLRSFNVVEYSGYGLKAFLLSLPAFFIILVALYLIGWGFAVAPPLGKSLISIIIAIALVIILFRSHPRAALNRLFPPVQLKLDSSKKYIIFTFDTEEDWGGLKYYNSYLYITSGAFYQLVDGLNQRGVRATFYITPSLATQMPEVLKYVEDKNHTIGVHLHPHNLIPVDYPYLSPYVDTKGDEIKHYSSVEKKRFLELAKAQVEATVGHPVLLFRSGRHSCDYELEKIAKAVGFKVISNHKGSYFIKPVGLWNLDAGAGDILDLKRFSRLDAILELWQKERKKGKIITFPAHPMRLYNHALGNFTQAQPALLLEFVDYLRGQDNVEFITQEQLLHLIEASVKTGR